jgi:hypothetical protein
MNNLETGFYIWLYPIWHLLVLFTGYEPDGSFQRIFYIDDVLYFASSKCSEGGLDRFKKDIPARFNLDFQGTVHWYLSASKQGFIERKLTT